MGEKRLIAFGGSMSYPRLQRRTFILGLGSAAVWPCAGLAQLAAMPRLGYVWIGARGTEVNVAGLRQGLLDKGYVIGRDFVIEERYADGHPEQVSALIDELLGLNTDILLTPGTPITLAAKRATSTVPIICVTGDPIGAGLVTDPSRPGGNVTGLWLFSSDYSAKWLELLQEAVPNLHRVAVLWNHENKLITKEIADLREAASYLKLDLTLFSTTPADAEGTLATIANAGFGGLVVTTDYSLEPLIPRIIAFAAARHLPTIYPFGAAVQQGGLISYSADFFAIWRRAAGYVDQILKGARAADLPIEQATELTLNINLKTAKEIGLTLPATLLARADNIIK
jgi:putative tryptophan/tyrosine transport system substrate-binding protein